jgi:hypothetical protein
MKSGILSNFFNIRMVATQGKMIRPAVLAGYFVFNPI